MPAAGKISLAILISGRGSNMDSLIRACADPSFPARVAVVVSSDPAAPGLDAARRAGVPAVAVGARHYPDKKSFETALLEVLTSYAPDMICLAGFMRILSADFIAHWPAGCILNIHPSLLPAYKGLHTHERVLADSAVETGCTVHVVTPALDEGPIVAQARVPVEPGDTPATLAARVLAAEHRLYPQAVATAAAALLKNGGEYCVLGGQGETPMADHSPHSGSPLAADPEALRRAADGWVYFTTATKWAVISTIVCLLVMAWGLL